MTVLLYLGTFMAVKLNKKLLVACFVEPDEPLTIHQINANLSEVVPERTLRRWLAEQVSKGTLVRLGQKRSTRYQLVISQITHLAFLHGKSSLEKSVILKQLRDLWTHTSTALEGNTLTLGDSHFLLEEGLTISGKPIKEHQEILGHASAIELLYQFLLTDITKESCFLLHKAVQTEIIYDIDKPNGAWKVRPNGTYTVGLDEKPLYLEYALPLHVDQLMAEVIKMINSTKACQLNIDDAHLFYAKIHAAIAHIHPFWDGNGRIARLLANVPLLKSGLPPIVIPKEKRREYIQILAAYEIKTGQLNHLSSAWGESKWLADFEKFCLECYQETRSILKCE